MAPPKPSSRPHVGRQTWHMTHVRSVREPSPRYGANWTPPREGVPQGEPSLALLLQHGLRHQHLLLLFPLNGS